MTMAEVTSLDIEHLRRWVGREEVVSDVVSLDLARKFHAMLDLSGDSPRDGAIAPRLIHFCLCQPAVPPPGLGRDGHPARGGFLPPVALPRRMWAGGEITFHSELKVGDVVRRVSRVADVTLKRGRTGPLCFVLVHHAFDVDGRPILEERQDIVYREDGTPHAGIAEPSPGGMPGRPVDTSTTTLFRYSALTFNGHRIHYDRRYAIEVEGYRGLVVHGPLQATLLHNFAAELAGRLPAHFKFRGLSALIDDDNASMHAEEAGGRMRLWISRDDGSITMSAEAGWT